MRWKQIADEPKVFVLIFETGDEIASVLRQFAKNQGLGGSSFKAIGALSYAKLGWFNWDTKKYEPASVLDEQVELLSLIGDIALKDGASPCARRSRTLRRNRPWRTSSRGSCASHLRIDFDRESDSPSEETRSRIRNSADPNWKTGSFDWRNIGSMHKGRVDLLDNFAVRLGCFGYLLPLRIRAKFRPVPFRRVAALVRNDIDQRFFLLRRILRHPVSDAGYVMT